MSEICLCVETSSPHGELSLFKKQNLLAEVLWGTESTHSEVLSLKFEELLEKAQITSKEIHKILVSQGPGSFTGLRVGINFAKSLAYALDLPLYPSLSLRGLLDIEQLKVCKNLIIVRRALRNQYYLAAYKLDTDGKIVEEVFPTTQSHNELEKVLKSRRPASIYGIESLVKQGLLSSEAVKELHILPESDFGKLCQNHFHLFYQTDYGLNFEKSSWKSLSPLYIRASEAEEKLKTGELKLHTKRTL